MQKISLGFDQTHENPSRELSKVESHSDAKRAKVGSLSTINLLMRL